MKSPNDAGSRQTTSFAAMSTRPSQLYVLPFLALACLALGCNRTAPLTQDQAVAAAIDASDMSEPLAIVSSRAGIAGELWDGVRPSWAEYQVERGDADEYMERLRRPAWLVVLDGTYPRGPERLELVIDLESGDELFRHSPPFQPDQLFSGKQ